MRVVLGTTMDRAVHARFPPKPTGQKVELVKAYFSAVLNPHNTFHVATKDTRGSGL